MKRILIPALLLLAGRLFAQHEVPVDTSDTPVVDSMSILKAFKSGTTSGHLRYFFMGTDNARDLPDYYAHAAGGGLKYETAAFRGFQFGVSGFFIYNLNSSNLAEKDPRTNQGSRYEIGLFDLEDPENKHDIDRLEELYLKYQRGQTEVTFGKQLIHTPFINPQDGRMRPTEVDGIFGSTAFKDRLYLTAGWIYKISPRSTVDWYPVARSIGINSQGLNPDGSPGNYRGHLASRGVGLLGLTYKMQGVHLEVFDQFVDNIFNTALLQAKIFSGQESNMPYLQLQYINQVAVNNGGNADPTKQYFPVNNNVHILGTRVGWQRRHTHTSLNYTRITGSGRFTMPREWGIEPLFTNLQRERNEGLGNVHAIALKTELAIPKKHLKIEAAYGHYYLPDAADARLNKYQLPSYSHARLFIDYTFKGLLSGMDAGLMIVRKDALGRAINPDHHTMNKVDLTNFNLVLNYRF